MFASSIPASSVSGNAADAVMALTGRWESSEELANRRFLCMQHHMRGVPMHHFAALYVLVSGCVSPTYRYGDSALAANLGEHVFHFELSPSGIPLITARIAGVTTRLVIDTGATYHALDAALVKRLGRRTSTLASGSEVLAPVDVDIDGTSLLRGAALPIVPLAVDVSSAGVGGVLAPQALAGEASSVILDFPRRQMRLVPREVARTVGAETNERYFFAQACNPEGAVPARRYFAQVRGEGLTFEAALASGAAESWFVGRSPLGAAIQVVTAGPGHRGSSSVGAQPFRTLEGLRLEVGNASFTVAAVIVDVSAALGPCPLTATLGMDVLSRCVLVLEASLARVSCGG